MLEKVVEQHAGDVELVKVDVDAQPELARRFDVSGIPAVKAFRGGRVVDEFTGALSPVSVETFVTKLLGPPASDAIIAELRRERRASRGPRGAERG